MKVYDSNVWIALINTNDRCHKKARTQFQNDIAEGVFFLIPEYILLEVVTVLRRISSARHAARFIELIATKNELQLLHNTPQEITKVCAIVAQEKYPKLSFADISLLILSSAHTVITYDTALKRAIVQEEKHKRSD